VQNSNGITDKASALLSERAGNLPVWVRANTRGPEHFTSIGRSKLYELAGKGLIRSVSIRQPGQVKGTRLFHLQSVLDYVASCEATPEPEAVAQ
jgi:hypothetical protein